MAVTTQRLTTQMARFVAKAVLDAQAQAPTRRARGSIATISSIAAPLDGVGKRIRAKRPQPNNTAAKISRATTPTTKFELLTYGSACFKTC